MPRALQIALMWIVSLAWIANVVIGYIAPALGQQQINVAFMAVIAVLMRSLHRKRNPGNDDDSDDEPGPTISTLDDVRRMVGDAIAGNDRKPGDPR